MIIKNGSLEFQSGNEKKNQKGKPWKEVRTGRWTPHQPKGKPARHMILTIEDGDKDCSKLPIAVKNIQIRYFGPSVLEIFQITTVDGHAAVRIPVVIGSGLSPSNSSNDYPTIERSGSSGSFTLTYTPEVGVEEGCNVRRARIEFTD